jgi:pimeloyl-ACP methyl ester carboxylesterase
MPPPGTRSLTVCGPTITSWRWNYAGHGHSTADSATAEQYWQDLAIVTQALGWHRPLLIGHSTGGYAVIAATDWLNAGASASLIRAVAARSLLPDGPDRFAHRPSMDEIAMTITAHSTAAIYPSIDIYDRIICPMTIVLPGHSFYAHRRGDVEPIVAAAPRCHLVDIDSNHNIVMTRPDELASIIGAIEFGHV